jgi:hypothetical protein
MAPDALKAKREAVELSFSRSPLSMITSESYHPLQLKGEIMDMEFTADTDHRWVPLKLTIRPSTCRIINLPPLYSRRRSKIGREGGIGLPKAV